MLFIDLDNLKIVKEFNYTTEEYTLECDTTKSLSTISTQIKTLLKGVVKHESVPVHYIIHWDDSQDLLNEEVEDAFISIVNITLLNLFKTLTTQESRGREYRLDVADKLKGIHVSYSLLKNAINNKTINDVFNLTITYKDLIYNLCDEKDFKDVKEFVHTVDELESKHE